MLMEDSNIVYLLSHETWHSSDPDGDGFYNLGIYGTFAECAHYAEQAMVGEIEAYIDVPYDEYDLSKVDVMSRAKDNASRIRNVALIQEWRIGHSCPDKVWQLSIQKIVERLFDELPDRFDADQVYNLLGEKCPFNMLTLLVSQ